MTTVIYPNNSVEVDGRSVNWTPEDFARHGVALKRVREIPVEAGHAEHRHDADHYMLIFPTKEIAVYEVRANAEREREPKKTKPRPTTTFKVTRPSHREHEYRNGELFLRCRGNHSCGQILPADHFYAKEGLPFGIMYLCKADWNQYLKKRKNSEAS